MTAITDQPKNMNLLTDVQFRFDIKKLPNVSFFLQQCSFGGLQVASQNIGVPGRSNYNRNTGVIEYEPFVIIFLVDEYLKNWQEIHDWMVKEGGVHSEAVLTILSSSMNPTMEIHFKELCDNEILRNIAQNFTTQWFKLFEPIEKIQCRSCKKESYLISSESRTCQNSSCGSTL